MSDCQRHRPGAAFPNRQGPCHRGDNNDVGDARGAQERLRGLMNQSKVVVFIKGTPDEPRCGFSRKICGLLKDQSVEFSHFDILTDESVRQGERRPSSSALKN